MNNFTSYSYRNYNDFRYPTGLSENTPQRYQSGITDKNSVSRVQKVANKIEEIIQMCEKDNPDGNQQLSELIKAQKGILNILTKSQAQSKNNIGGKSQIQQITSQIKVNDSQHINSPTKKRPNSQPGMILGQQALSMIEQIESKALKQIETLKKHKSQLEKAFQEILKEYNLEKRRRIWLQSQLQKLLQYLQQNSLGINFKFPDWYQQGLSEVQKLKIPEFSANASQVNTQVNASQPNSPQVNKQNIPGTQNYSQSINQQNVNTSNGQLQKQNNDQQHFQQIINQQKQYQQQINKQQQKYFQQLNQQQKQFNQQLNQQQQLYQKQIQQYQEQLKHQRQQFNNSQRQIQQQYQNQYEHLTKSMKLQQQNFQNQLKQQKRNQFQPSQMQNNLYQQQNQYQPNLSNQQQSQYQQNQYQPNLSNQQQSQFQQNQPFQQFTNQQHQPPSQFDFQYNPSYNPSNQRQIPEKKIFYQDVPEPFQQNNKKMYSNYQEQTFPFATSNVVNQNYYAPPNYPIENQRNVMGQFRNQIQDLRSHNNYISENIETQNVELQRRLAQAERMANSYYSQMQRWGAEDQRMNQIPGLRELLEQGERIRQQTLNLLRLKNEQVGRGQTFGIPGGRRSYN